MINKRSLSKDKINIVPSVIKTKRPIGLAKNQFVIPESFFEPLPKKFLLKS